MPYTEAAASLRPSVPSRYRGLTVHRATARAGTPGICFRNRACRRNEFERLRRDGDVKIFYDACISFHVGAPDRLLTSMEAIVTLHDRDPIRREYADGQ
jgi:hypothetical protein